MSSNYGGVLRAVIMTSASLALAAVAMAGAEKVAYPHGYQSSFNHYASVDRKDPTQVAELYANQVALDGLKKDGKMPAGSVLVMEIHNAKLDADKKPVIGADGQRIKDSLKVIAVMQKCDGCGADQPDALRNGDWDYAFFSAKDKARIDRDYKPCFECHKPLAGQDYVFSFESLPR